jgi:putative ABC transport system ATP-binding protein
MLLQIRELEKEYHLGKTIIPALRGLSFDIDNGDFVSIMGPSGCGKTTLLNIIGCIDKPTRGTVLFKGIDVSTLSENQEADLRQREIGFIFQSFNLVPVLSVCENIELPLLLGRHSKAERQARVTRLVELVGLNDCAKHKPDELSGGQRQRVAIARALVNNPSLIIADEPTANLDSENSRLILEEMARLNREEGVSFIFSTHNPDILPYAKRLIRLKDGQIDTTFSGGDHDLP